MQNHGRRVPIIAVLAATLGLVLTACGSGDGKGDHNTPQPAPHSSTTLPAKAKRPVTRLAYPEVGTKKGVVQHGTSIMNGGKGLNYTCARGLKSFTVDYGRNVMYNGVTVSFVSNDNTSDETLRNDTPWYNDQESAVISFAAADAEALMHFHPVSMIVTPIDVYVDSHDKRKRNDPETLPVDESVVNLPATLPASIKLQTLDFTAAGYIGSVTFCATS